MALTLLVGNWVISSHVGGAPEPARVPYTVFRAEAERGNVAEVTSQRDEIGGRFRAAVRVPGRRAGPACSRPSAPPSPGTTVCSSC